MSKEETEIKDLADTYKELSPENRANLLAMAHATHAAQENTKKSMKKERRRRKRHEKNRA
jgi:hypothetical protein